MGELSYSFADVYPDLPGIDTRTQTVAEPSDQMALVDDQDLATANPVEVTAASHKSMTFSIAVIVGIIVLLSLKF